MPQKPPPRLSRSARRMWDDITTRWELRPDEVRLLEDACREATILDKIERELAGADYVMPGSQKQLRAHPLLSEVRQHRVAMAQLLSKLNLPDEEADARAQTARSEHASIAATSRWGLTRGQAS